MSDDHLRRCVLEELRKAQGQPLSPGDLFDRCGGAKATNLNVDAFMAFIGQHCSRAVKVIHDVGDENSLPRYALHVDSSRKTGTLKRRAARSSSHSSSLGGTPDATLIRFNPRTDGFPIFCHIVRKLSSCSQDGTINWNVIRNQYRKETGRHLNAEELNAMCGTSNMTKHDLLSTHLSSVVQILDRRGQIVRPASPFNPKTPSPASSRSRSSQEDQLSPVFGVTVDINQADGVEVRRNRSTAATGDARRQHIVEQLRKNGVYVDANGRAVTSEGHSPLSSNGSESNEGELKEFMTPAASFKGVRMPFAASREDVCSGDSPEQRVNVESGNTSFVSADQILETSGECGYTTGDEATPESDVSLNFSADRSARESTPGRTHEITLCNIDESIVHHEEEEFNTDLREEVILEDEDQCEDHAVNKEPHSDGMIQKESLVAEIANDIEENDAGSEKSNSSEASIPSKMDKSDEVAVQNHAVEVAVVASEISESQSLTSNQDYLITPGSPGEKSERSANSYYIQEAEKEPVVPGGGSNKDVTHAESDNIDISSKYTEDWSEISDERLGTIDYCHDIQKVSNENPAALMESGPHVMERIMLLEKTVLEDGDLQIHKPSLPAGGELPSQELTVPAEEITMQVKEQVEKFEHLHDADLNASVLGHFHEEDLVKDVDVMEIVHDLEQSGLEPPDPTAFDQEVELLPDVHVQETVHRLEHEFDPSLPVCDEYVQIASREEHRQDAGDAPAVGIFSDESVATNEQEPMEVVCHMDVSRADEVTRKTVTVTVGEITAGHSAELEQATELTLAPNTCTVIVDVNPCMENKPKLKESDTWEREFVVASGSTATEISRSPMEVNASAAHEFIGVEVEKLEKGNTEEGESATKPAVIIAEEIGELGTTEEMPSMPVSFPTQDNTENKSVTRSKRRGHVLLKRRRIIDCCSIL